MPSRSHNPLRRALLTLVAIPVGLATFSAFAQSQPNDRAVAQQWIASAQALPSASASNLARPLQMAREALSRADQAKASGDEANARLLEGLAREWAQAGQDLAHATDAEKESSHKQAELSSAEQRAARAKAMLETLAQRKARAEGELVQLAATAQSASPSASAPRAAARPATKAKPQAKKAGSK